MIPVEIILPADSEAEPELSQVRSRMIEPARFPGDFLRTIRPIKPGYRYEEMPMTMETLPTDDWEKILIHEGSTTYWAWRHICKQLVFI